MSTPTLSAARPFLKLLNLTILLGLVMSVIGFVSWRSSLKTPSEESLVLVEGRVVSSRETFRKRYISAVKFRLSGHPQEWHYSDSFPNYEKARDSLIPGARVRLRVLPRRDFWQHRIWGMEVSGSTITTFQMMESYSRRDARWGFGIGIGFLAGSTILLWMDWQDSSARRVFGRWRRKRKRLRERG
jgi:hypothetical protein